MKLGAEPKKVAALVGLLILAPVVYYVNSSDDSQAVSAPRPAAVSPVAGKIAAITQTPDAFAAAPTERRVSQAGASEFKPRVGAKDPKDRPDPSTIDPTIRWDLLAKVQSVELAAPGRNLFQFGAAPAPPPVKLPTAPKIPINAGPMGPTQRVDPGPPPTPPKPTAPQITMKYYGYQLSKSDGHKAAFLLDGEDILIAGENDTLKKHYRIVKIEATSITIEDMDFKTTQRVPLAENQAL